MRPLVVVPTYNERENVRRLVGEVLRFVPGATVLFVDDSSPDGTAEEARRLSEETGRVEVIVRPARMGLGTAFICGMEWGLSRGFNPIVTMDADLSHHPKYLPAMLERAEEFDVVVGSRYVPGGGTKGWPLKRRLLSRAANFYARSVLGLPARDVTGSFRCYRAGALSRIDLRSIRARGFVFNVEILYRLYKAGCSIVEVPIVFAERESGRSKMSLSIAWEGVKLVWALRRG